MRTLLCRQITPAIIFLLVACAAHVSLGQGGVYRNYSGRYRSPYGPTLSPYLNYFRQDTGVLDPYNTFIRPLRQLDNQLGQMQQQEQAANTRLQQQIQGIRAETAAPTGTGATFMNYSHYYRTGRGAGGMGGNVAPRR